MVASIWQRGAGIGMRVNCRHGTRRLAELITSENHDKHDINKKFDKPPEPSSLYIARI